VKPVLDTNILIDYLNGIPQASQELARYPASAISPITWIEVMAGATSNGEEARLRAFLGRFTTLPVDRTVAETSSVIRRQFRLRLPDAIIWATARTHSTLLVTRNTRDFPESEPDIRVPYRL
jgi:predicted nucleic acid-binding protein